MRNDVLSVEISFPHPLLERSVEIIDLPGTNDREEQDSLVYNQLLTTDLVIQVLDARKLMTLGEREGLRDWLMDRGIKTVIFVINFINLLEKKDQKEVLDRARYIAESFRASLPPGVSNMYRVDALPALRAKLKGDTAHAISSGIMTFESAVQSIIEAWPLSKIKALRLSRATSIIERAKTALNSKIQSSQNELDVAKATYERASRNRQQSNKTIKGGFDSSIIALQEWLDVESLVARYQTEAVSELEKGHFQEWRDEVLKATFRGYEKEISKWVAEANKTFSHANLNQLSVTFPDVPSVNLPERPSEQTGDASSVVNSGLGWGAVGFLVGGPFGAAIGTAIGAAASHGSNEDAKEKWNNYYSSRSRAYRSSVKSYLENFGKQAKDKLKELNRNFEEAISRQQQLAIPSTINAKEERLKVLKKLHIELVAAEIHTTSIDLS